MQSGLSHLLAVLIFTMVCSFTVFSQETVITVPFSQPAGLKVLAGADRMMNTGESLVLGNDLEVLGGAGDYKFTWTGPGNLTFGDSIIEIDQPGVYTVSVSDENFCTARDSIQVSLITGTGKMIDEPHIYCFPNPSQGILNYTTSGLKGNLSFSVLTQSGTTILRKVIISNGSSRGTLDLQHLSPGVYFLRVSDGRTTSITKFILKQGR